MGTYFIIDLLDSFLPLLTMAFGIYGAANDTKPKDGRMTREGKIAVFGIIVAGLFSFFIKAGNTYNKIIKQETENYRLRQADSISKIQEARLLAFQDSVAKSFVSSLNKSDSINENVSKNLGLQSRLLSVQKQLGQDMERSLTPLSPFGIIVEGSYTFKKDSNLFKELEKIVQQNEQEKNKIYRIETNIQESPYKGKKVYLISNQSPYFNFLPATPKNIQHDNKEIITAGLIIKKGRDKYMKLAATPVNIFSVDSFVSNYQNLNSIPDPYNTIIPNENTVTWIFLPDERQLRLRFRLLDLNKYEANVEFQSYLDLNNFNLEFFFGLGNLNGRNEQYSVAHFNDNFYKFSVTKLSLYIPPNYSREVNLLKKTKAPDFTELNIDRFFMVKYSFANLEIK